MLLGGPINENGSLVADKVLDGGLLRGGVIKDRKLDPVVRRMWDLKEGRCPCTGDLLSGVFLIILLKKNFKW
jgi:hypothetical protein